MDLIITHSPHFRTDQTTKKVMIDVLIALTPVSIAAVIYFGVEALILMLVSMFTAMLTESFLYNKKEGISEVFKNMFGDGSAAVTGLIFAHVVSPLLPIWIAILGSFFAIFIGKYVFGGIGSNTFNPALVGRAILVASFPAQMTTWLNPIDAATGATPLVTGTADKLPMFLGMIGGSLGETSALAILVGAAYLLYKKHITWHTPVAFVGSVAILSYVFGVDPIYAILAGGVMYGAFFMATDMVTTPITRKGQFIFGLGCGLITIIIREFGALPEGVMFSILIMNSLTPLIDRLVKPRLFGGGK
ncbi:MAG: RnfABCDGE type electron transport complex subunit D [Clostridia bacterium]